MEGAVDGSAGSATRYESIDDGEIEWRFDSAFLVSGWTCIWGRGCRGILDRPAAELGEGCCSVGARIEDDDEARLLGANVALLEPARFEYHDAALAGGVVSGETSNTRVVDGACIFLNRPGFDGGEGCALHLAAIDRGESPIDWKPSVCWRLPLAIDWTEDEEGKQTATVRRWERDDWGPEGHDMAWWCVEEPETQVGHTPLWRRMHEEIETIAGAEVAVELSHRLENRG